MNCIPPPPPGPTTPSVCDDAELPASPSVLSCTVPVLQYCKWEEEAGVQFRQRGGEVTPPPQLVKWLPS